MAIETATTLESLLKNNGNESYDYSTLCLYMKSKSLEGVTRPIVNLLHDYKEELVDYIQTVTLTTEEVTKYKYNPKRLAYDIYGHTTFYSFILFINNMASVKEFNLNNKKIKLIPNKSASIVLSHILKAEEKCLDIFNSKNK